MAAVLRGTVALERQVCEHERMLMTSFSDSVWSMLTDEQLVVGNIQAPSGTKCCKAITLMHHSRVG